MIGTLLRISWLNLKRDRVALGAHLRPAAHLLLDLRVDLRRHGRRRRIGRARFRVIAVDLDRSR